MTDFTASLDDSIALAERLETRLIEEIHAIETRDFDRLPMIVAAKRTLAERLEQRTQVQKQALEHAGFAFTADGIDRLFASFGPRRAPVARWSKLQRLARRCDQMNKTNHQLIERQRQRIAAGLRLLRGDDGGAATYTPDGQATDGVLRSRSLSQA